MQHSKTPRATSRAYSAKLIALLLAMAGLLGYAVAIAARRVLRGEYSDFQVFYFAAGTMLRHGDPYAIQHRSYIYPPLLAFLYMPLALLPQGTAAGILLSLNAALVVGSLALLTWECMGRLDCPRDRLTVAAVSLLALLIVCDKIKGELQMFQTNALQLVMVALALRWLDKRPLLAGGALGFACNIKYLPLILLPWLLLRRRWAAAGSTVACALSFALLPAVYSGWNTNLKHLEMAFGGLTRMAGISTGAAQTAKIPDIKAIFSVSITSAIARFTHAHRADAWIGPAIVLVALGILCVVAILYRRRATPLLCWPPAAGQLAQPYRGLAACEWAALMALALAFSPQTNTRHLVLLLPTSTVLAAMVLVPQRGLRRLPLWMAIVALPVALTFPWDGVPDAIAKGCRGWFVAGGVGWTIAVVACVCLAGGLGYARALSMNAALADPLASGRRGLAAGQENTGLVIR